MSTKYYEYLHEHCSGVRKGLQWMADNLPGIDHDILDKAMSNAEVHDNSKMQPEEYKAYDDYFYGGNKTAKVKEAFDYAWLHHIHNNPHHWQYWVLINDDASEGTRGLEMPLEYVYEMIADWWSFSWKKGNLMEIFDWYDDHKKRIIFHQNTKKVVETILGNIKAVLKMQQRKEQPSTIDDEDETVEQVKLGDDYLAHHGIMGQKWGIKNGPPYPIDSQLKNKTPAKVDEIKNYKGKLYWLSESDMEGRTLIPRIPKNYFTENGYEDSQTPRLCFTPSVDQCLSAISQNLTGKTYTVYEPESMPEKVFKPNKGAVPDSEITGELWVKEPVKLKSVGSITVKGDDGKDGMKFEYGDKEAELYGWEYEWNGAK